MKDTDEDLMLNYKNGDSRAFEILYLRHKNAMFSYLTRQCGNQAIAEELFQEIWMKLIRARERYTVQAKFTTYIYHMAHNLLIDFYRKQKHGIPVSYNENSDDESDPPTIINTAHQDPAYLADIRQQAEMLGENIKKLPEAQKEAFLLREEAGLSLEEIAQVTGVSAETAKSRLRYAVRKLRQAIREYS